jgi:hypothetical protein
MALPEMMFSPESAEEFASGFWGGAFGVFLAFGILAALLMGILLYVYFAFAWYTIARKLKHKNPWLAWIPFANVAMILQLGGFHWAWVFLFLIPIFGWIAITVLLIIATWRIFERRHYPGWLALLAIIPYLGGLVYLVTIGFVAWKDRK